MFVFMFLYFHFHVEMVPMQVILLSFCLMLQIGCQTLLMYAVEYNIYNVQPFRYMHMYWTLSVYIDHAQFLRNARHAYGWMCFLIF